MNSTILIVKKLVAAAIFSMASVTASAQVVTAEITAPASMMTETMNWIENMMSQVEAVIQTAEQIAMVEQQIQMVENMITNTVKPAMQMWARVQGLIDRFNSLHLRLRRITDMETYLAQLKSLDFYKNNGCFAIGKKCTLKDLEAWRDRVLQQSKSTEEALKQLVEVVDEQKESLGELEQKKLKELMKDASDAKGNLEAIGSTNALLGNISQQLMTLRTAQLAWLDTTIERTKAEHDARVKEAALIQKLHGDTVDFKAPAAKRWKLFD